MGQYFYISNATQKRKAESVRSNFGLGWFPKLNTYSNEDICGIIENIINEQGWDITDRIIASGDDGDWVEYHNGIVIKHDQ